MRKRLLWLYRQEKVSLAKAAGIAGVSIIRMKLNMNLTDSCSLSHRSAKV